jgi:uncharacterized protein (TIGR02270 family)
MGMEGLNAPAPAPIWRLVEDSLDEAEYLWRRWEAELSTHARDLQGLSLWVEERLLGSLDGVRVGGDRAIEALLQPALAAEDPFRATAAAYVLASEPLSAAFEALTRTMGGGAVEMARLRRAVELVHSDLLLHRLERALSPVSPTVLAARIDAHAFQGRAPGNIVSEGLDSGEPFVSAAALRALRFDRARGAGLSVRALGSSSPALVEAGMETGLILGEPDAWAYCQHAAGQPVRAPQARLLVALLGKEHRQRLLFDALGSEVTRREALFALGFAGTRQAAVACLEVMQDAALAALAGEAFCAITGLDLEQPGWVIPPPEGPEEPVELEAEDLDADLVPTPDDFLPVPDVARVLDWWRANQARFTTGQRYLRGEPLDFRRLYAALHTEPMRRRPAIAQELAVRTQGAFQLQTRAFSSEQRLTLASHAGISESGVRSPLIGSLSRVA